MRITSRLVLMLIALGASARADEPKRAGPDWWSLQPLKRPDAPKVKNPSWVINPIDAFVLTRLEAKGLSPAAPADRQTLIRRVTFDVIGLPPTMKEIDDFLNDRSENAFEKLIDRLLDSPHYGERWGRHWLDLARFSESHGFERDQPRDNAWRYRDYVINAFNRDKPYADFVREQLAGSESNPEGIIATGFLVAGPYDEVGHKTTASQILRIRTRENELEEMLGTVGQTFFGLTVNCARCHDHKFDPFSAEDYYRLKAVFDGVWHGERTVGADKGLRTYAAISKEPGPTFVFKRGDPELVGEKVTAGPPSQIAGPPRDFDSASDAREGERRTKLAEWIVHRDNPLTWRVMANRLWQHHFGEGIVRTPNDFGYNGERPTHPELLDWLAATFRDGGGSMKKLHRLILLSATYRQSSRLDPKTAAIDADNRLLWRFAPRRLEAEIVRDSMLAVSGQLNDQVSGPSFRPFKIRVFNSTFYDLIDEDTPDLNRRSVYRMNINSAKDPLLEVLDCPDPSTKTPKRPSTTTPLQALTLMNSIFVQRQANAFAERVKKEVGEKIEHQVERAYWLALGRALTKGEADRANAVAKEHGLKAVCWALLNASEFVYIR